MNTELETKIDHLWYSCVALYHNKRDAQEVFFKFIRDNPDEFVGLKILGLNDLKKKRKSGMIPDFVIFDDVVSSDTKEEAENG